MAYKYNPLIPHNLEKIPKASEIKSNGNSNVQDDLDDINERLEDLPYVPQLTNLEPFPIALGRIFQWQGEDDENVQVTDLDGDTTYIKHGYFYKKTSEEIEEQVPVEVEVQVPIQIPVYAENPTITTNTNTYTLPRSKRWIMVKNGTELIPPGIYVDITANQQDIPGNNNYGRYYNSSNRELHWLMMGDPDLAESSIENIIGLYTNEEIRSVWAGTPNGSYYYHIKSFDLTNKTITLDNGEVYTWRSNSKSPFYVGMYAKLRVSPNYNQERFDGFGDTEYFVLDDNNIDYNYIVTTYDLDSAYSWIWRFITRDGINIGPIDQINVEERTNRGITHGTASSTTDETKTVVETLKTYDVTYIDTGEFETRTEIQYQTQIISTNTYIRVNAQPRRQADWNQNDTNAVDFIKNKPEIQQQIQSDWSQTNSSSVDYIKNKPTIPDISDKMDKSNPAGSGSFSLNRKSNTTIGDYSVAEGFNCEASGEASHAEGSGTEAIGEYSHAEGYSTLASGDASHAEGDYAQARGEFSHAEGERTLAGGKASHAEGRYTIASTDYQHVQGYYNIDDANGTYAHIVGNGTISTRSNAYTLDWNGNGWFAGNAEATRLISNIIQGITNTHTSLTGASPIRIVILPYIPYSLVDPTHINETYLKGMLDWILEESHLTVLNIPKNVPLLFVGVANPNSQGLMFGYCYGITTENSVNKMQYANFYYYPTMVQIPINFGYNSYTWFYKGGYNMTEIKTYIDDIYYEFRGIYNQSDYNTYKCRLTNNNTYSVITLKANTAYSLHIRGAWYSSSTTGLLVSTVGHTNGVPNAGYGTPANVLIKKEVNSTEALHLAIETWVHTGSTDETLYIYTKYSQVTANGSFFTEVVANKIR